MRSRSKRPQLLAGACCVAALCALPTCRPATPLSAWTDGIATNYGGPADGKNPYDPSWGTVVGSCGYGLLNKGVWPHWSVAALSSSNSFSVAGPVQGCGQCFQIQCVDKAPFQGRCITGSDQVSVIVQITDSCPECAADHIDIQALTYQKLSPMSTGRISIQYRRVECVPPQKIVISVDNSRGPGGWLRLFVESAGGMAAVKGVQARTSGSQGGYVDLTNKWGSAWETPNAPNYPLDVNIIGADGDATTAYQALSGPGQLGKISTGVQFKITNPSDSALTEKLDGSAVAQGGGAAPSGAPSGSPSPTSTPTGGGGGGGTNSCGCSDRAPSQYYTCQQQAQFGSCGQSYMTDTSNDHPQGYCQITCGRCPCGSGGGGNNSGQSNGNNNGSNNNGGGTGKGANGQTCPCTDTQPDSSASCAQQAGWGNCGKDFMTRATGDSPCGHCMRTCGRCSASA